LWFNASDKYSLFHSRSIGKLGWKTNPCMRNISPSEKSKVPLQSPEPKGSIIITVYLQSLNFDRWKRLLQSLPLGVTRFSRTYTHSTYKNNIKYENKQKEKKKKRVSVYQFPKLGRTLPYRSLEQKKKFLPENRNPPGK